MANIPLFIDLPITELLERLNLLIIDINAEIAALNNTANAAQLNTYSVSGLPSSPSMGAIAFATDGRKIGEGTGSGTGVPVYYSLGQWRTFSDDSPVTV